MDRTQTQTYLNKFWNYKGSNQMDEIQAFLASNPGAASGVGKMSSALNKITAGKPIAKLNNGGYIVGYNQGGLEKPTRPVEPKVVEKPQDPGKDPGKYSHFQNRLKGKTERAELKNKVSGDIKVTQYFNDPNKKSKAAKAAKEMLKTLNAPHEEWKKKNAEYKTNLKAYNTYIKAKEKYDAEILQFQQDAEAYNAAVQKATQAKVEEMQAGVSDLSLSAVTDPEGTIKRQEVTEIDPATEGTVLPSDAGQITGQAEGYDATTVGETATADAPKTISASTFDATTSAEGVSKALEGVTAEQGEISAQSLAQAATVDPTKTAVGNMQAAQGSAIMMQNPVQREIQDGELVSGVADAAKASAFTEQIQAAEATPSAQTMVQNQLESLMADFDGGDTPAWAAGAMRAAMGKMAARGLGASSIAGQAAVQAAMESALPIAMADAQTQAQFEMQNLSNRQQRAMLAAQQRAAFIGQEFDQAFQARVQNASRIADVANMNFNAEQQVALENSRAANTMNLANLSNEQAMVMAQAAAISQLEQQNLSNEQQAAVQNANAFLQMDMTNLNNRQQTSLFKSQSLIQSLFNDQAADNAAKQFNAASENQTKQFMANLEAQVSQFNAGQLNAINQFNAGQKNAAKQYNAGLREQRKQFNATNRLVVAQANTLWRQNVATLNTAEENNANREFAKDVNALTNKTLDEIWQRERDIMDMAFKAEDSRLDRVLSLLIADKDLEAVRESLEYSENKDKVSFWYDLLWPFD
jgi:hypothetical protein|tara:strand:+ start:196 stop:2457 length:2262 start_codon:yes stop_codon:yes gene_type:complete